MMEVLQYRSQITEARQRLRKMGVSFTESFFRTLLRRVGLVRGVAVGDNVKSWDVLATIKFIEENLRKDDPILDIGCYASELIVALHKLGYSNLSGADLNPDLCEMPYQKSINYNVVDFTRTGFADSSFRAITAVSVIEHGFRAEALLAEISRLLKPGGYFIASFDYWPDKIETTETKFFGMDWQIFSQQEVAVFVGDAADYGLTPTGPLRYAAAEKAIACAGRDYTFAWLVFQKQHPE